MQYKADRTIGSHSAADLVQPKNQTYSRYVPNYVLGQKVEKLMLNWQFCTSQTSNCTTASKLQYVHVKINVSHC